MLTHRLTLGLFWLPLALATALSATVFGLADFFAGSALAVGIAVLWGIGFWRQMRWLNDVCLIALVCLMGAAMAFRLNFVLPLLAGCAAMLTWDLASFLLRRDDLPSWAEVIHHLRSVGIVAVASAILLGIAQFVIIQLSFWAIVGVVIVLMTTLGIVLARTQDFARKQQDHSS